MKENKINLKEKMKKDLEDLAKVPGRVFEEFAPKLIPLYKYGGLFFSGYHFARGDAGQTVAAGACFLLGCIADKLYNTNGNKIQEVKK
ncbi:MAG: hypothetical protein IB618_01790 [Candidatus Pacearchaeota archaeon]|nr:MAG: hypothetical protein IB618_01790 [Candidatus Pacearchaeota archaeon]